MNNAFVGKTMENKRDRVNLEILDHVKYKKQFTDNQS